MRTIHAVISFTAAILLLAGCATPTPQTIEVTRIVQETVLVTQLVEIVVTATPIPPTPTPEVAATPTFARWTTTQAGDAILAAGLEFVDPKTMTVVDYGMAPMTAQEGIRFLIPSICADCGGRLMSFSSQADLELTKSFYDELSRQSALLFSWVFAKDNILIQINGDLPESKALEYQAALEGMK